MIQTIVKRDGRIVGFNEEKIASAIRKAMLHTDKGEDQQLIRQISDHISFRGASQMTVEEIQDMVEVELMKSSRKDVAQKYIAYRNQRSIARKAKTRDIFLEIINIKSNDVTRENANMNADTPAGMMMKFASETTKPFVDDYLLSEEVLNAVKGNYLHIHDKDYYPTKSLTCVQHPLDNILRNGFSAGHGESRPAKRIETASILGCISLETAQNEMHGGQAIPAFDFYLAPYVRYSYIEEIKTLERLNGADYSHLYLRNIDDYLAKPLDGLCGDERWAQHAVNQTVARVHQAMEAFIHNMNTIHSRGGNQVVFSSINYGTDTSAEGRCIIRELLNSTYVAETDAYVVNPVVENRLEELLKAMIVPSGTAMRCSFAVIDPLIHGNSRVWQISSAEDEQVIHVRETEDSEGVIPISALTEFLFGQTDVHELSNREDVILSEHLTEELDKITRLSDVFLNEIV